MQPSTLETRLETLARRSVTTRVKSMARQIKASGVMPAGFSDLENMPPKARRKRARQEIKRQSAALASHSWVADLGRLQTARAILLFCRWERRFPHHSKVGEAA